MVPANQDQLKRQVESAREQLASALKSLGEKNVNLMKLRRQLDAVPGNAELNQYQRRFTELCTQGYYYFFVTFLIQRWLFSISKKFQIDIVIEDFNYRFYILVNEKQTELNGYYLLYNTLEDTKVYLNKELSLLTSIHDKFSQSMTNSVGKGEFLQQMEKIVAAVRQNKNKVPEHLCSNPIALNSFYL